MKSRTVATLLIGFGIAFPVHTLAFGSDPGEASIWIMKLTLLFMGFGIGTAGGARALHGDNGIKFGCGTRVLIRESLKPLASVDLAALGFSLGMLGISAFTYPEPTPTFFIIFIRILGDLFNLTVGLLTGMCLAAMIRARRQLKTDTASK